MLAEMRSAQEHIPFLDHFRGLAIFLVFVLHCLTTSFGHSVIDYAKTTQFIYLIVPSNLWVTYPAILGWVGVSIFFVISGFCIHLSHQRSRNKDLKTFAIRRFFRIYPPYVLTLIIFLIFFPSCTTQFFDFLSSHDYRGVASASVDFVSHLFLIHNFGFGYHINGPYWSVAVEFQLYALYPVLLWMSRKIGWRRALMITAISEFSLCALYGILLDFDRATFFERWFRMIPLKYWFSWSIGAALADAYIKGNELPFQGISLFAVIVLFFGCYSLQPISPFCFTLASLATVIVMARMLKKPMAIPEHGPIGLILYGLRWMGIVSYSYYLIFQPLLDLVLTIARKLGGENMPILGMYGICLLSGFPIFGLSYLFYRYIELPSIEWGKCILSKRNDVPVASL